MLIRFGSYNRVAAPHEMPIDGNGRIQCSAMKNFIYRDGRVRNVPGTQAYNSAISANPIPWVKRSYHLLGDSSFVTRTLCYSNGYIYYGDDALGTLTSCVMNLTTDAIPLDMTFQVSGNSILFLFTGQDTPRKYDGNGSYAWENTTLDDSIFMGVEFLDRAFYIKKNSSELDYSETIKPEIIEDTLIVGNDKNSCNVAITKGAEDSFFIFKNNSIYQLLGSTPATFKVKLVTDKYGLSCKRALCPVGSGWIFQNTADKELYFFGGTEASITSLTEKEIRLREIINTTVDSLNNVCMTVHDGLFRFAFQHRESYDDINDSELVYPINEPQANGLPYWSLIRGTNVLSYSVWNQQGDNNELVTGRSDTGKLMYHGRSQDFDGVVVEKQIRTGAIVGSPDSVCDFDNFVIKGKPSSANKYGTFRYYLDGRFSDRGESNIDMEGETRTVGGVKIQKSLLLNEVIHAFMAYGRGNSISFEIYDNQLATQYEMYSINFDVSEIYKMS